MKPAFGVASFLLTALPALAEQAPLPFILDDPVTGIPGRYVVKTDPGIRYDLWESTDLQLWTRVVGWPKLADGMSLEHRYTPTPNRFFRAQALDEQPPVILSQLPQDHAFAVRRFDDFRIVLGDATAVDPASIRLTIGESEPLKVGAPGLTFANNILTYDSGDASLGDYAQSISATLVVADTLGHALIHTWSFQLESQPEVVANLYVFGSPTAQRAGQVVSGPTAQLAKRFANGPIRANDEANLWSISDVQADRIVIAYTGAMPPPFTENQFICNLCPVRVEHIFYRRIIAITDNAATKKVTLTTTDVPLTDMVQAGSVGINRDSVFLTSNSEGNFVRAVNFEGEVSFPRIGYDISGSSYALKEDGFSFTLTGSVSPPSLSLSPTTLSVGAGPDLFSATAREFLFWFTPRLRTNVDIGVSSLKRFEAIATGTLQTQTVLEAQLLRAGVVEKKEIYNLPFPSEPSVTVLLGAIGPIPVYATVSLDFKVTAEAKLGSSLDFSVGQRSETSVSLGLDYIKGQPLMFIHDFTAPTPELIAPALGINLEGSVKLAAEPQIKFLIYALVGVAVGSELYTEVKGTAGIGVASRVGIEVGANATLGASGPALDSLDLPEAKLEIWSKKWTRSTEPLAIESEPTSKTLALGQTATFSVNARAFELINYQWYHKGRPIPGATLRSLVIPNVNASNAGDYKVRLIAGTETMDSQTAVLNLLSKGTLDSDGDGMADSTETNDGIWISSANTGTNPYRWDSDGDGFSDLVETNTGVYIANSNTGTDPNRADSDEDGIPDGLEVFQGSDAGGGAVDISFTIIPAGNFIMGDQSNPFLGDSVERPVHSVYLDSFLIGRTEVTKAQWDRTILWATANAYSFSNIGQGKDFNHPVHSINWFDIIKWCNASSEQRGLQPCYVFEGSVYRDGQHDGIVCDFSRNGFRLPTEAEWEKAARGGFQAFNFPWGNTIAHTNANYWSSDSYAYDISATRGFHPTYATGSFPYTAPVGSFEANGYGLYDMIGNVSEWCWDWHGNYSENAANNPRGPLSGSSRVLRGETWGHTAFQVRTSFRADFIPSPTANYYTGFRLARSQ